MAEGTHVDQYSRTPDSSNDIDNSGRGFPVVCLGGSAGDIDSFTELIGRLPANLGAAVVIVHNVGMVIELLQEVLPHITMMPVVLVTEKLTLEPNRVYLIPEDRDLHVLDGEFHLRPTSKPQGWPDVITVFLRSLAKHWRGRIIAVILSGYDGDGAPALRGIKDGRGYFRSGGRYGSATRHASERYSKPPCRLYFVG